MGHPRAAHGAGQWYVIARHGDMVMRLRPRMVLGETPAGELSFEPSCAQLELDVAEDGALVINTVDGHELEGDGGPRRRSERLARERGAEIRLAHNVVLLDTDFVDEPQDVLAPLNGEVASPEPAPSIPGLDSQRPTPVSPEKRVGAKANPKASQSAAAPKRATTAAPEPLANTTSTNWVMASPARQLSRPLVAASVAAIAVAIVLGYLGLRDADMAEPEHVLAQETTPQSDATQTVTQRPTPSKVASADLAAAPMASREQPTVSSVVSTPTPTESKTTTPSSATTTPTSTSTSTPKKAVPAPDDRQSKIALVPSQQIVEPRKPPSPPSEPSVAQASKVDARPKEDRAAPSPAPIVTAPVATSSIATAPATNDTKASATKAAIAPKTSVVAATPPVAPSKKEPRETTRTQSREETRQQTLLAADQALAQGKLTTPPEASAYALYNKVLALDPGSQAAARGLKSVRENLVNRVMAQLASNALNDARASLQAAADVGVDPLLVGNLQDEIDYRQRAVGSNE